MIKEHVSQEDIEGFLKVTQTIIELIAEKKIYTKEVTTN